ncbi:MAG: ATP-binding cassette domain-containing protein [Hydrogenophaga sp.]|nr:ATP-binding cassette domain-containing protein [Hydrogenophaga sp.]NIN28904.1 ATP-binding cassette domain-containing protein [Hydrogenophaga sp.]NIN33363.1 ATP-binding cassette domain-containing protein [Hydrogenophaga sp.]NIN58038.1 ATP-binding cassette domain-containing protein [Hydrogenophaga sp.]NIO54336.1 ATP-binding cassette domain-containing protein [Hydrogenophaga sp.]
MREGGTETPMTATTAASAAPVPALAIHNIQVVYGGAIEAVRDVSLEVRPGQIVALLGSNGAGKSTVLKAVSGVLDAEDGVIEKGSILLNGRAVEKDPAPAIVRQGMVQVPEGRRLFQTLTVEENLITGAHLQSAAKLAQARDFVFSLFPRLAALRQTTAGYLSGGEQQMVAIGRALMSQPKILVLDEPSLGLAPLVVSEIFRCIQTLRETTGLTILLVEQNASRALAIADYAYIMENGRVVMDGTSEQLRRNADVREFYLGLSSQPGRTSMKDVKHYKRRKRWLS